MENITLGEISIAAAFLVGLITGIRYLHKQLKQWIAKLLKEQFDSIKENIDELHEQIENVDMQACKNYLVSFLSDAEKNKQIDETELERFWEQYQHYTEHGGNSYIKRKVEYLKSEGKL